MTHRELKIKEATGTVVSVGDSRVQPHIDDTTNVHGIADTADLATKSYADGAAAAAAAALVDSAPATLDTLNELAAALGDDPNFATTVATQIGGKADASALSSHESDTTSVHGISDTANLVYTNDARLSDTRTPTDGSVTSAKIADGAITTAKIGDGQVTAAKLAAGAAVPSQTGQAGKYLTTDGTTASWGTVDVSSKVSKTGDTMTGGLNFEGADINLRPEFNTLATVTGVTSTNTTRTISLSLTNGISRVEENASPGVVAFTVDPAGVDDDTWLWMLNLENGMVVTFVDSRVGTRTYTIDFIPFVSRDQDFFFYYTSASPADADFGPGAPIPSTTTGSLNGPRYVITTDNPSLTLPPSVFFIGDVSYWDSLWFVSGATITMVTDPGNAVGERVGYYSTTPSYIKGFDPYGDAYMPIWYDPDWGHWRISDWSMKNQPLFGNITNFAYGGGYNATAAAGVRKLITGLIGPSTINLPASTTMAFGDGFTVYNVSSVDSYETTVNDAVSGQSWVVPVGAAAYFYPFMGPGGVRGWGVSYSIPDPAGQVGKVLTAGAVGFAWSDLPTDTTRAPLASPALTGTPTAPTAAANTNTTQIATTAFVATALSTVSASASPEDANLVIGLSVFS